MGEGVPGYFSGCHHGEDLLVQIENGAMTGHRGNFDIIADILDASHGGAKKTYLMYRCNLSFKQLKNYSHFLLSNGMLCANGSDSGNSGTLFELTSKGREFLRAYKSLKELMK